MEKEGGGGGWESGWQTKGFLGEFKKKDFDRPCTHMCIKMYVYICYRSYLVENAIDGVPTSFSSPITFFGV